MERSFGAHLMDACAEPPAGRRSRAICPSPRYEGSAPTCCLPFITHSTRGPCPPPGSISKTVSRPGCSS